MKVFLTAALAQQEITHLPALRALARQDRFGVHNVCDDPQQADIILFVDSHTQPWHQAGIRNHPLTRRYRHKTFVYDESDQPWCALPGLYVSMPRSAFQASRQRACAYVSYNFNPSVIEAAAQIRAPDILFSFLGRNCHPTRARILSLTHPRACLQDTSGYNFFAGDEGDVIRRQQAVYSDIMARSRFVLCPRGTGPASFRLFETMAMGRVPVILSDEWVPPVGPRWNEFALIVPERDVDALPALIEAREGDYDRMAALARHEWTEWFAPDVLFHRMAEGCKDILENRRISEAFWQRLPDRRRLRLQTRALKAQIATRLKKRAA